MSLAAESDLTRCVEHLKAALPGLQAVYLFGSQATEDASEGSDVDLAVLLLPPLAADRRWELMGRLADLLDQDVDLVDLRRASTIMQHQIVQDGKRLWSRNLDTDEFELTVLSEYWDLSIQRQDLIADIKQRGHIHGR